MPNFADCVNKLSYGKRIVRPTEQGLEAVLHHKTRLNTRPLGGVPSLNIEAEMDRMVEVYKPKDLMPSRFAPHQLSKPIPTVSTALRGYCGIK